jgi:hypothetical protein
MIRLKKFLSGNIFLIPSLIWHQRTLLTEPFLCIVADIYDALTEALAYAAWRVEELDIPIAQESA